MTQIQDKINAMRRLEKQVQMLVKDVAEMREVIVVLANQLHALANPDDTR